MKNRVLITGAQGFIGRYLVAHWLAADSEAELLGVGRSPLMPNVFTHTVCCGHQEVPAALPDKLSTEHCPRYKYVSLDVRHKTGIAKMLKEFRPNVIVHLASFLRGGDMNNHFETNLGGTVALIEALAESAVEITQLVIGSTGGVYGAPIESELPLKETAACSPVDLYAVSKLASELASRVLVQEHQVPTVWARLFNVIGAGQQEYHVCGRFAAQIAAITSGILPPLIRVRSLKATRDFIDARDVAVGLKLLAEEGRAGEIYNLGSGRETSIQAVLEMFLNAAGSPQVQVECFDKHDPAVPRHFASIEKVKLLGFGPKYELKQSVESVIDYYWRDVLRC
jgi:nucleoside-diphosphate-sugar epimerase